jgi:hypothetical protein
LAKYYSQVMRDGGLFPIYSILLFLRWTLFPMSTLPLLPLMGILVDLKEAVVVDVAIVYAVVGSWERKKCTHYGHNNHFVNYCWDFHCKPTGSASKPSPKMIPPQHPVPLPSPPQYRRPKYSPSREMSMLSFLLITGKLLLPQPP